MKVSFGKLNTHARVPKYHRGILEVTTPVPVEIQPGERVDLKTGLSVRVPEGHILSIQALPSLLVLKGLSILGPTFVAAGDEDELKIPLHNVGKSQINLQPGDIVGTAILHSLVLTGIEEFTPEKQKAGRLQRKTPKKDPFKFEVS
jgi:dUTPase